MTRPVVVGVDTTESSAPAIRTAVWEAGKRGAPLVLAHGTTDAMTFASFGLEPYFPPGYDPQAEAANAIEELVRSLRARFPALTVHKRLWRGSGAGGLVDESETAGLVVVGARGSGGFAGLSIGSVAAQVAAHARCPVLVVRPPDGDGADETVPHPVPQPGPVVVGVDGSESGPAALRFAFEEATMRDAPLIAVNSWWLLPRKSQGPAYPGSYDDQARAAARRRLAEAVADWSSTYPEVRLEQRSVHDLNPSITLIEASREAGLVVVGSRGRGGFTGLLLGSVGRDLVGHSYCPVAVVHTTA